MTAKIPITSKAAWQKNGCKLDHVVQETKQIKKMLKNNFCFKISGAYWFQIRL